MLRSDSVLRSLTEKSEFCAVNLYSRSVFGEGAAPVYIVHPFSPIVLVVEASRWVANSSAVRPVPWSGPTNERRNEPGREVLQSRPHTHPRGRTHVSSTETTPSTHRSSSPRLSIRTRRIIPGTAVEG
eukprot:GHVU01016242.1.p3 GENE.GHVU01016242.1~~GHVU01016242.1.p3  ORF type:complete len:128 (-),score=8.12 GHVU01016242.1:195-578(-)